jgi:serine protease Do
MDISLRLGEYPDNDKVAALSSGGSDDTDSSKELEDLGLTLVPAPDLPGSKTKEGVAVSNVDPSSRAADQGLKRGDIIVEVNNKTVSTVDDVVASIREAREKGKRNVLLQIRSRDRQQRYVALPIDQKLNRGKDKDAPKLERR